MPDINESYNITYIFNMRELNSNPGFFSSFTRPNVLVVYIIINEMECNSIPSSSTDIVYMHDNEKHDLFIHPLL